MRSGCCSRTSRCRAAESRWSCRRGSWSAAQRAEDAGYAELTEPAENIHQKTVELRAEQSADEEMRDRRGEQRPEGEERRAAAAQGGLQAGELDEEVREVGGAVRDVGEDRQQEDHEQRVDRQPRP